MNTRLHFFYDKHVCLLMILGIGLVLRISGISTQSYWVDEIYSAYFSDPNNSIEKMALLTLNDVHPPLYQFILWLAYQFFGYTEATGRLLSSIIGCFGILSVYFLGKELFNRQVGLYAAFFSSLNYYLIYFSQETRSYSLLFLLATLSYLFFIKVLRSTSKIDIVLYWAFTIAMYYTHYFGFFIVISQLFVFLYHAYNFQEVRKKVIALALITSTVFVLSLLPIENFILMNVNRDHFWISTPPVTFFISYIHAYFNSLWIFGLFVISAFVSIYCLLRYTTTKQEKYALITLIIWVFVGYFVPYLRSVLGTPLLESRYTIIVLPAILVFVSYGVWRITDWRRILFQLLFVCATVAMLYPYYTTATKEQFRDVLQFVDLHKTVPIYSAIDAPNLFNTYSKLLAMDIVIRNIGELKVQIRHKIQPGCFWVVDAHGDRISDLELDRGFRPVYETNYLQARGVLFSYHLDSSSCLKRAGFIVPP